MKAALLAAVASSLAASTAAMTSKASFGDVDLSTPLAAPGSCSYPTNCPDKVLPRADKQTWAMNASTIIMP